MSKTAISEEASSSTKPDESGGDVVVFEREDAPPATKRRKGASRQEEDEVLVNLALDNLPNASFYEKSYMHRGVITHVVATRTNFIITASVDGHVKFWKKREIGIEFVKHFRAHLGAVSGLSVSSDGLLLATFSQEDATIKIFDVLNFDMINIIRLSTSTRPTALCWSYAPDSPVSALAVATYEQAIVNKSDRKDKDSEESASEEQTESSKVSIVVYDGRGQTVLTRVERAHATPVTCMRYNVALGVVVSCDLGGLVEFWSVSHTTGAWCNVTNLTEESETASATECTNPFRWRFKIDTDLFEFAKAKSYVLDLAFSNERATRQARGIQTRVYMATWSSDRKVRLFNLITGRCVTVLDETVAFYKRIETDCVAASRAELFGGVTLMEYSRKVALENELAPSADAGEATQQLLAKWSESALRTVSIAFDSTGTLLCYSTPVGIKVVSVATKRCLRIVGKRENLRFLNFALYQGASATTGSYNVADTLYGQSAPSIEHVANAAANPLLDSSATVGALSDPTFIACAFRKNRFYLLSRREPGELAASQPEAAAGLQLPGSAAPAPSAEELDRDVLNEKPSKEEVLAATRTQHGADTGAAARLATFAVLHTTMGDIHIKLFASECPRTIENFAGHARSGYFNNLLFHRVIRGFMIQTGDPNGDGTGGESIWGGEFADEFHPSLRHDQPFTVSMANAGPNTNGSQFFITVAPTPWLNDKHTVFGRVVHGRDIVQQISQVKTNSKTDRPLEEIKIVSVSLK